MPFDCCKTIRFGDAVVLGNNQKRAPCRLSAGRVERKPLVGINPNQAILWPKICPQLLELSLVRSGDDDDDLVECTFERLISRPSGKVVRMPTRIFEGDDDGD
jgi:hypothetical protein